MEIQIANQEQLESFLSAVQSAVVVVDQEFRVVTANRAALEITGRDWRDRSSCTCYGFLFGKKEPCQDCLLKAGDNQQRSVTIRRSDGEDVFVKLQMAPFLDYYVVTLQDVTREVSLLRKVDLLRKEQQAKNVILEQRSREVQDEQRLLKELLDHLPEALVSVEKTFIIEGRNKAVSQLLSGKADAQKCYELFGYHEPCSDCPAHDGFDGLGDVKKTHQVGDRYVTEGVSSSPFGSGGLLLFRDTTRQISLIERIREQQQTILRKSKILECLADLGTLMQKESELQTVVESFWQLLLHLLKRESAVLLVSDIRAGSIGLASGKGVDEEALKVAAQGYLSREIQSMQVESLGAEFLPWQEASQIILKGRSGGLVGMLLLQGDLQDQEEKELVDLFSEPLGAYIDNRLLSRKLEEKANTDALTGLYNRAYLEQAMKEEQEKFEKFNINFAVVVADVNRLKKANDVYGHEAGDRLILKVSELLQESLRSTDTLARTGGDEFVILLAGASDAEGKSFAHRLYEDVFNGVFMDVGDDEQFPVNVSFGVAGTDVAAVDSLTEEADREMYAAKERFYQTEERYR